MSKLGIDHLQHDGRRGIGPGGSVKSFVSPEGTSLNIALGQSFTKFRIRQLNCKLVCFLKVAFNRDIDLCLVFKLAVQCRMNLRHRQMRMLKVVHDNLRDLGTGSANPSHSRRIDQLWS